MIKMAQLEDIRKMYFMEGLSIREINRRIGIQRYNIEVLKLGGIKTSKIQADKGAKTPGS